MFCQYRASRYVSKECDRNLADLDIHIGYVAHNVVVVIDDG